MKYYVVVIDTNVFVAALISKRGAAYELLLLLSDAVFQEHVTVALSTALVLEYESTSKRLIGEKIMLSEQAIDDVIDYVCATSSEHEIYFQWRPFLSDPKDDMVLEVAISAEAEFIITYNLVDFRRANEFGITPLTPRDFLDKIGVVR